MATLPGHSAERNALLKAEDLALPFEALPRLAERFVLRRNLREHRTTGQTPWERWMENLEAAHGLNFDPREVFAACKLRQTATVARDGILLADGQHYASPKFNGLVDEEVTLRLDPDGGLDGVEAYHQGRFLDRLRPVESDPTLAEEIGRGRLARLEELQDFKRRVRGILNALPADLRAPAKAEGTSGKKTRGSNVRKTPTKPEPVPRFEGHVRGDEDGSPVVVLTPEPGRTQAPPGVPPPGRDSDA